MGHLSVWMAHILLSSIIPNRVGRGKRTKKFYVGDELLSCKDQASMFYRYPMEKVGDKRAASTATLRSVFGPREEG